MSDLTPRDPQRHVAQKHGLAAISCEALQSARTLVFASAGSYTGSEGKQVKYWTDEVSE